MSKFSFSSSIQSFTLQINEEIFHLDFQVYHPEREARDEIPIQQTVFTFWSVFLSPACDSQPLAFTEGPLTCFSITLRNLHEWVSPLGLSLFYLTHLSPRWPTHALPLEHLPFVFQPHFLFYCASQPLLLLPSPPF